MAEALETAIEEICYVLKSVSGLRQVPINPPETISVETFAVVYPFSGDFDIGPIAYRKALHNIAVDLLVKRSDLARNFQTLKPLIDLVASALIAEISTGGDQFNHSILTFESLSYSWTSTDYGGVPVVGYHFLINKVKIFSQIP